METIYTLIPIDPKFQPSKSDAQKAADRLRALVPNGEVRFEFLDTVTFFNPGSSWPGVRCPVCHADAAAWWPQAMLAARAQGFESLAANAACCGAAVDLNELDYAEPTGFAKFALEAHNPGFEALSAENFSSIEQTLGTRLRAILARLG